MHAFIFLVLMTPSSGGGIWDITPMPNTDVCIKMLRVLEERGGRGYGSNTGAVSYTHLRAHETYS